MSESDEALERRARAALDESLETLPPGVATRLAASRRDALAGADRPRWHLGGRRTPVLAALAGAGALVVAVMIAQPRAPEDAAVSPDAFADLPVAMEQELLEDIEFLAWLELEAPPGAAADAG